MTSSGQADYAERNRSVSRVLLHTLFFNWMVAAIKIVVGLLAGNLTVVADGFHSILDGANNVIGIVTMRLANKPADEKHPYGHAKFEHVAAMLIGALVMLLCYEMFRNAFSVVYRHFAGTLGENRHEPSAWYFYALVGAGLAVNLFVAAYEGREGKRLGSPLLRADSKHTLSDSAITGLSFASLALSPFAWWLDPLLASFVGVMLFLAAFLILRDNLATMTDRQRLDPGEVRHVAENVEGVLDAHAIRSHGMENDVHLDLHIVVSDALPAAGVTDIEEMVRRNLKQCFPQISLVAIHHETEKDGQPELWRS